MKLKALTAAALAIFAAQVFAASPAATQEWVRRYIATNGVASATTTTVYTNGVTDVFSVDGTNAVRIVIEDATEYAYMATNVVEGAHMGITNGTIFVINPYAQGTNSLQFTQTFVFSGSTYTNTIEATRTNILFKSTAMMYSVSGIKATAGKGFDFVDSVVDFRAVGVKLQPSVAKKHHYWEAE